MYDTTNGFAGVANPCDFVYYAYPRIGFFELKSVIGNSLPFSNITEKQWNGLLQRSKLRGVVAAILIQFRESKEGYLVPIQELQAIKNAGKCSINRTMAKKVGMPLNLEYKRTRCRLDSDEFRRNFLALKLEEVDE